ncbi:substrate-binding periplasmic protein [Paraburkholderia sp.]|uniref:substrate-binding periplasmic protein n=1 Tax=Paraburkholderia sp. TaxID=1926495 RepID=UPI0039E44BA8
MKVFLCGVVLALLSFADYQNAIAADGGTLSRVQQAKKVIICTSNDVPYAYRDPKTQQVTGTDIDMDRAILGKMGVTSIDIFEVPISGIISALNTGRCDMISDNIAITVKRSEQVSFSTPMYKAGQALIVPKGNPANIHSERDFHRHTVGSYLGTIQLDWLNSLAQKDPSIQVKPYKNIPEILAELRAGRLDAGAFDDMVAADALRTDPTLPIQILDYKMPIGDYAVGAAFRKDDVAFRQAFDEANRQFQLDGGLTKVLAQWRLTPVERYYPFPNCCQ